MTTITYRAGVMCSDSQATRGDFIDNKSTTKIYEVGGSLIGISGNAISAKKFVDWFAEMMEHSTAQEAFPYVKVTLPEKMVEEDFHALVVYPDQTAYEFFGCDNVMECAEDYAAVGSGMLYALCAMDAGATAEEAVNVAIKRDVFSGGDVQVFNLEPEEELSEEDIRSMSHEDLLKLVLGEIQDDVDDDEPETLCEVCLDCEDLTDDDGVFVQFFPNEENPVYSLYFNKAGEVWDGDTEPFKSFLVEVDSFTRQDLKMYANTLGVTYAHNTKKETLATNLDIKVKEIVDSLNEE